MRDIKRTIKKILIEKNSGKRFYVKELEDFHTSFGAIKGPDLKSNKTEVKSASGNAFWTIEPTFSDLWENLQRGPQVVTPKDIGLILAKTGINRNSSVVDAGGGSGALCLSLANVCKEITVYEINPEHHGLLQKNINLFGLENINLKQADVYAGIKEKDIDLITLDLPEPWKAIEHAEKALKPGGHLVIYLPNISQITMFIDSAKKTRIKVIETVELLERKWKIEGNIIRPEFQMLGHTGFLTFCRKF